MDGLFGDIGGLPAHPLLVHAPIVLIPLLAVVAIGYAVLPRWRGHAGWALLALAVLAPVSAVLAASSGEALAETIEASAAVADHGELGETARNLAGLLGLLAIALIVVDVLRHRRPVAAAASATPAASPAGPVTAGGGPLRLTSMVLSVLVIVAAAFAIAWLVQVGHSGAELVWIND